MENQKTAIQKLIEETSQELNGLTVSRNENGLSAVEKAYYNSAIIVCKDIIRKATELLEAERKQIMDSYIAGRNDCNLDFYPKKHAAEYFTETYEPNK